MPATDKIRTDALVRWRGALGTFAIGGAWFFIVFSLLHMVWVLSVKFAEPTGYAALYQTTVGANTYGAWALAYPGVGGLLLALAESAALVAAVVLSLHPLGRRRRAGHLMLLGWSALWAANMFHLASVDLTLDSFFQAAVMVVLFTCTLYRLMLAWPPRPGKAEAAQLSAPSLTGEADVGEALPLVAEDVSVGAGLREITGAAAAADAARRGRAARMRRLTRRAAREIGNAATALARSVGTLGGRAWRRLRSRLAAHPQRQGV